MKLTIEGMKERIEQSGSQAIWNSIEQIGNWKLRVMYRQLFFLSGGTIEKK